MAAELLKQQLAQLQTSMFEEGLLDEQFHYLHMLQDDKNPRFVMEVVAVFCDDTERILTQLDKLLAEADVNFGKVDAYAHQLMGSSSSVGAQKVNKASVRFRDVCDSNNKNACLMALHQVKDECLHLQGKLQAMLLLDQRIQAYEGRIQK